MSLSLSKSGTKRVFAYELAIVALSTMFSVKKRKGKLRKAWEGSKVIYNVASWSATAIGYNTLHSLLTHSIISLFV